jgi:hypothetical protein
MKRFFAAIKKKKNKRRLTALWLFLVVIELFCPVLDDKPAFAAEQNLPIAVVKNVSDDTGDENQTSINASDNHNQNSDKSFCSDDCLCHGRGMTGFQFSMPQRPAFFRSELTVFFSSSPHFNSPSPPYPPPKIS